MTETPNIKLRHFKTIGQEYQWFLLYEFQILSLDFLAQTDEKILKNLIGTRIFRKELSHPEMGEKETQVVVKNVSRPYEIEKIDLTDWKFIKSKSEFQKWLRKFRTDDWEEDREDAQILIDKAEKELWSRTIMTDGVWYLSKENFEDDSDKLIENHWIYLHFETFIEIDRQNKLIRTFDFGYD